MSKNKNTLPSDKRRKRLIKAQANTNPQYGKPPEERNIKELLNNSILNLDKPSGPTSHQIDSWIKDIFKVEKVGHGGTLDPNATGVLPIAIGDATKALQYLLSAGKEYVGIMKLHKKRDKNKIIDACKSFVGNIYQIPPLRSAVKRKKRKRKIYYLDVIQIKDKNVLFKVGCESGTYTRTLCVDIGKKLKTGAHLAELRRTKVGHIDEKESIKLQDLKDGFVFWKDEKNGELLKTLLQPIECLFDHLPKIIIRDSAVDALCHGANLALPGVLEVNTDIKKGDKTVVLTLKGEVVAVVKTLMPTEKIIQKEKGICGKLECVLMKKGTYPSLWKKS